LEGGGEVFVGYELGVADEGDDVGGDDAIGGSAGGLVCRVGCWGKLGEIGLHLGLGGGRLMAEAAAGSGLLAVCRHVEAVMSWLAHHD